jgi:hypothetical protein
VPIREYRPEDLHACRDLYAQLVEHHREIYDDPTIGGEDPGAGFHEPRPCGVLLADRSRTPRARVRLLNIDAQPVRSGTGGSLDRAGGATGRS